MLLVSIGFALLFAEFVPRLVLNPVDLLKLDMIKDDVLVAAPSPSAMAEFDRWGFRNRKVPETADVVVVGDSHTYQPVAVVTGSSSGALADRPRSHGFTNFQGFALVPSATATRWIIPIRNRYLAGCGSACPPPLSLLGAAASPTASSTCSIGNRRNGSDRLGHFPFLRPSLELIEPRQVEVV